MSLTSRLRSQCFIGDDLIISAKFTREQLDIAPYNISSELRTNAGLGLLAGTLIITKDLSDELGRIFGFTAKLPNSVTQGLITGIDYGLDFKFELNGEVQHTPMLLIEFLARGTV